MTLPADATLGVYSVIDHADGTRRPTNHDPLGGGSFRVEEYKKPEYEVTVDAPNEPVMLGEKIEATIKAKYYFGSPVTKAKVKYKVQRTGHDEPWYPPRSLGLALRPRLLVVRLRLRLVSRLEPSGAARGRCPSGGRGRSSRRSWSPIGRWRSAPTAR